MLKLDTKYLNIKINEELKNKIEKYHKFLHNDKIHPLGFIDWPQNYDKEELSKIKKTAKKIQTNSDILIVIGVGGSYLGAKAAIDFLKGEFYNDFVKNTPKIYFAGNSMSTSSIISMLDICKKKDVSINVISKSGTTIEPAVTFKIFKDFMEKKYGKKESSNRIFCTTDEKKGDLKKIADKNKYKTFVIPNNIGGRFSVLTPVGLLPMAVSGIDIEKILKGAKKAREDFLSYNIDENICYKYAAIRNILHKKSKQIEILSLFEPRFLFFGKWFEQLFGESEGKNLKGLFPTSLIFSSDLHSMGQLIQEGSRNLFETIIFVENKDKDLTINCSSEDFNIKFLNDKKISTINQKIFKATAKAHFDGNVPVIILKLKEISELSLGYMFYFFEKACSMSGLILGVDPFNQPGVEKYKNNMFSLLGK